MTKIVAVLDTNKRLVGTKQVADDEPGVEPGDLPTDGRYKWDEAQGTFIPLGHGFGKVGTRQPYSTEMIIAKIIEAMGDAAPFECKEWLAWYNQELRRRDEEFAARPR
jgi:hypothetical protein